MSLILLSAAVALLWVLAAGLVGQIAEHKGLSYPLVRFLAVLLPFVDVIVVSSLPLVTLLSAAVYSRCTHCSNFIKGEEAICPYCHADLHEKPEAEKKAA